MVFLSILDDEVKANVAREILEVTRPGNTILWYDFWLNPTNPQTRGIRPAEIKRLFPNCCYEFHRITLAPPIARKLAPISWGLCLFLESLKIFNTHYLVAIRPRNSSLYDRIAAESEAEARPPKEHRDHVSEAEGEKTYDDSIY